MKTRDIVIGLLVLIVVVGFIFLRQKNNSEDMVVPQTLSSMEETQEKLESKLKIKIPEDVDKAELKDVSGGSSSGIATSSYKDAKFTFSVLADLPEPTKGYYEAWLVKGSEGSEDYSLVSVGRLKSVKGGWTLSYQSSKDYTDYSKVLVTNELKQDKTPETKVLEGSF